MKGVSPIINSESCPLCLSTFVDFYIEAHKKKYFNCNKCGLIFMSPQYYLKPDDEYKRYQEHENNPNDPRYRQFLSQVSEPLSKILKKGSYGLDYGCGPGPTLSLLMKESGFSMENYDPFFFPEKHLLEKKYDFITCTEVAEHFFTPNKEFYQLFNMLKRDGVLAIMTEFFTEETVFKDWYYPRDPSHVVFYNKRVLEYLESLYSWELDIISNRVVFFRKQ